MYGLVGNTLDDSGVVLANLFEESWTPIGQNPVIDVNAEAG